MYYQVYDNHELIFETTNDALALEMVCNINESGGNAYLTIDENY